MSDWIEGLSQNIVAHFIITKAVPAITAAGVAVWGTKKDAAWSWPTATVAGIVSLAGLLIVADHIVPPLKEPPEALLYFKTWSISAPQDFNAQVDPRPLLDFKNSYRLMIACQLIDPIRDYLDNPKIEKSQLFDIKKEDIQIIVPLPVGFLKQSGGQAPSLGCHLCLVPRSFTLKDIQTLRHLVEHGGKILQPAGMGLIQMVPTIPPSPRTIK